MSSTEDPFDMLKPIPLKQPEPEELEPEASLEAFVKATSPTSPQGATMANELGGSSDEAITEKINAAVGASPSFRVFPEASGQSLVCIAREK